MPQSSTQTAAPAPKNEWVDVPTGKAGGADDGWVDVPSADAGTGTGAKPEKQGFKRSLRSAFGLKPEGSLSDDISQIGAGFKQMLSTDPKVGADTVEDLVKSMWQGQEDVYNKGSARMNDPNRSLMDRISGAGQVAESAIPVAGPILSRMGEQVEEGDYTGAAGTGLPLLAGAIDDPAIGAARGGLSKMVRAAPKAGGTATGYVAGGAIGHPYAGAYVGREIGRQFEEPAGRLADRIAGTGPKDSAFVPTEPRVPAPRTKPSGSWTPSSAEPRTPLWKAIGDKSEEGTSTAPPPKPRLSASQTKAYLRSRGGYGGSPVADDTAPVPLSGEDLESPKPKSLSPYMRNKVENSEAMHETQKGLTAQINEEARQAEGEKGTGASLPRRDVRRLADRVGEDDMEQARRGAPGESPVVKSLRRKTDKINNKLPNRPPTSAENIRRSGPPTSYEQDMADKTGSTVNQLRREHWAMEERRLVLPPEGGKPQ